MYFQKIIIIHPTPESLSDLVNISNNRPISLLTIVTKIFESIISAKITSELDKIIDEYQQGFRPSKSITTNLTTLKIHN